jgi:hypothetical protein
MYIQFNLFHKFAFRSAQPHCQASETKYHAC